MLSLVDFQGVADLIDTIIGAAPQRLQTLLNVLSSSNERLEARVVIELVLRCNDPLAPSSTLCKDALKAAADLDILLNRPSWRRLEEVLRRPRAVALLHLCDAAIDEVTPYSAPRRAKISEIRPRVAFAALVEEERRGEEIQSISLMRSAAVPNVWDLLEQYVETDKASALRSQTS